LPRATSKAVIALGRGLGLDGLDASPRGGKFVWWGKWAFLDRGRMTAMRDLLPFAAVAPTSALSRVKRLDEPASRAEIPSRVVFLKKECYSK